MEQFTFGNLIFPISYKQAAHVMRAFEAAARASMQGGACVTIASYNGDYLVAEDDSSLSFQSVMLDPKNKESLLSVHESVTALTQADWDKAGYLRMSVTSTRLANCFMRAHFKGTNPKSISFDVKGCGSRLVYDAVRRGFNVEGHRSIRNTRTIIDYNPAVHGM